VATNSATAIFLVGSETSQPEPLSQLTVELDDNAMRLENVDTVEGAGLQSQMERMKRRLEQLEKEKMDLSMSKAPLEARFRQKEDSWLKERARLVQDIGSSKTSLREADEKYRDLQVQYDQAYDECMHLRQEVRKASSSRQTRTDNTIWSRQLQNDRDLVEMKDKLRAAEEEINSIRLDKVSLEKELHATRIELSCLERNYDELKAEYDEIAAHTSENNEAEIKLQVLTEEHMATAAALNAVYADLDATKARSDAAMKEMEDAHKKEIDQLHFDLSVMKTRASKVIIDLDMSQLVDDDEEDEAVLRARIEERDKRIDELEAELLKGEQIRRQMHNCIQELRGNIRVYVRTRPFLPGDKQQNESPVDFSPDGESLNILDRRSGSPLDFRFDKVFPPSAGQELVFDEVSDFVQSALDGYHVCLFSYGQTGSGKTHTMQGCGNGPMRGIIPRAVEKVLSQAQALTQQKWKFTISASFLEIYNEELKDLLVSMKTGGASKSQRNEKLAIKRNREGKSYVDGLTAVPIDTQDSSVGIEQLGALMGVAARSRSVASTKMNSQSSRSHSVFILNLNGYNADSGAIVNGALNLCDLAGSERLDRSGAGADATRLKETQAINKSLSCLGDVFNSLATGASHVPYRNSKLTYLLQDCLSGDGKALMFVNLSPTTASSPESLCSLRFAQRVNQVELGKATKHIQYASKGQR
jgi:kinesin family protein C1